MYFSEFVDCILNEMEAKQVLCNAEELTQALTKATLFLKDGPWIYADNCNCKLIII